MNEMTFAVWVGSKQLIAGTKAECEATAANHNALYAGTVYYGPTGRVVIPEAVVAYLGD